MGLLDKFKKKQQQPLKELEMPPAPEGAEEMPVQGVPDSMPEFSSAGSAPNFSSFSREPEFPLPPQMQQTGDMMAMEMPAPPPEMREEPPFPQSESAPRSVSQIPEPIFQAQTPMFRFYESAEPKQEMKQEIHQQISPQITQEIYQEIEASPIDITKELLSAVEKQLPKTSEGDAEYKEAKKHSKQFITLTALYEAGEQLVNLADDLSLARDTAFRLTDLNDQELEEMVKWQMIQQALDMRVKEIDKLLFKA